MAGEGTAPVEKVNSAEQLVLLLLPSFPGTGSPAFSVYSPMSTGSSEGSWSFSAGVLSVSVYVN
jgi:hypothetical protein